ncbi:MAG: helix-turn-helix domain-containing protein, partial [Muribaculaceae bacterium]|nr:helix-turn-helix domain-containing protein [Muribaculaceae bacterium]
ADLDLMSFSLDAPGIVNIRSGQILQIKQYSADFECCFIVMSKRFVDNIFLLLQDCRAYGIAIQNPILKIDMPLSERFDRFYAHISEIFSDKSNQFGYQAMALALASFFLETAQILFMPLMELTLNGNHRIRDKFISLVQQNFKKERFLEFYSSKLEITPKHLSRTMKALTGYSAVEWIERYVILEAKVLLKSTNLSIQQIADELNFPSQSFFGKYFKKNVGMSPKDFRNI